MNSENQKHCHNCNSTNYEILHKGTRDKNNLDVLICKDCGLLFLSDFSHISEKFYAEGGMLNNKIDLQVWINATKEDDFRRFSTLKNKIKNKVLVDFGCGNGGFLNFVKEICDKVYGIELQKDNYDYFKKCNLNVISDIELLPEKVDFVTMFHVLEHLKNPVEELKKLKPYLKENAKVIIEVPNSKDALISLYNCKSFKDFVFWSCHLFVYNEKSLRQIVQKAGYKINTVKYIQRYNFLNHLYWIFQNKPGGHKIWGKFYFAPLNILYCLFLKVFKITDTLWVELRVE